MSKIVVVILASIIGAIVGYCGVSYYMSEKDVQIQQPVLESDELDKLENQLKKEDKAKIRG